MATWTTALPDWERRIVARESLIPCPPLFPAERDAALEVFDQLRMVDVAGSPTFGEVCRPWVRDFAGAVFGAYDPEAGRRLISEFFLLISKKNGKSTLAAGIMMTALLRNWRQSGEFLILAPTIEVANNAFAPCRDMVKADDELGDLLHVQDHIRTITHRTTGATLKVVAADSATVSGKKAIGVLVDELWEFGKRANAAQMLLEATGGKASRPEGFTIFLSTHSDEPPAGVFLDKLMFARGVRDGEIKAPHFMPVLYEFPQQMREEKADRDLANAYVTNPNLGASVDMAFLEQQYQEAEHGGEAKLRVFLAKHLNVEIGQSLLGNRWAGADFWERQADPSLTLDEVLRRSEVCVVGVDGGGLDDLFGLAVLGRCSETRHLLLWTHAWANRIVLERRKDIASRLCDFERAGDLTFVDEPGPDLDQAADVICRVRDSGLLPNEGGIGVDSWGIGKLLERLAERDILPGQIVAVAQGRLNGAIKDTERGLAGREFWHGGTSLMAWCVGNARVEQKAYGVTVTKQVSGTAKIDPLMATFDAASLMAMNPASCGRSWWDQPEAA